jgi:ABC-type nitrate/sulfonate/bicarbonate transport system substrate-binding protein
MSAVPVGGMPPAEAELAESLQRFIEAGNPVAAVVAQGSFVDMDKPWHILEANRERVENVAAAIVENQIHPTARIHDGAELRGKRMGISRYGSSSDFAARYLLKHYALRPEEDAALVQVGSQGARVAALKSSAIDGGLFEMPFNVLIAREGYRELITTADLLPYVHAAIFTTRGYVREHEAGMRQLARAFVEAIAYMKQNREFTKQVMAKYTQEEDPDALDVAYDVYVGTRMPRVPYASLDGIRSILEEVALTNPEALNQDPTRLVDDRFVRELETSGFIAGLYR